MRNFSVFLYTAKLCNLERSKSPGLPHRAPCADVARVRAARRGMGWSSAALASGFICSKTLMLSLSRQLGSPLCVWHGWLGLKWHVSLILHFSLPPKEAVAAFPTFTRAAHPEESRCRNSITRLRLHPLLWPRP